MVNRDVVTAEERGMIQEMIANWTAHIVKNRNLSDHYNGKVPVQDVGISIPPPMVSKLSRCSMMWCKQAVKRVADASIIDGFYGDERVLEVMNANELIDQYVETLPSQLQHGVSFWTVTAGGEGDPKVLISSYDAEHATALYDYRHRRVLCGLAIIDVDVKDPTKPTAYNFYAPDGTIVEADLVKGGWVYRRLNGGSGRCMMEVMRNDPDKQHPFGKSAITPAILSLEEEANREAVRMVMHSELYTAPTRWVMGAPDDIFDGERWQAYLGSIFALPTDPDSGERPTTGQYSQGDMQPHISYIRQLANQFAAEASIPIHSLLYTEANPASAEAIEASRNDLIEKVNRLNSLNGHSMQNIALMVQSILEEKPIADLDVDNTFSVKWRNPLHPSLAASADAATKLAASVPGFAGTPTYWSMLGYTDDQIAEIEKEIEAQTKKQLALLDATSDSKAI